MAIMQYTHIEPSFSPLDYTPIAWIDFKDTSTMTLDVTNHISLIADKSGNNHYGSQSSAASQPISTIYGGLFDGVNDYIKLYNLSPINDYIVFISAFINPISTGNNQGLIGSNSTTANGYFRLTIRDVKDVISYFGDGSHYTGSFTPINSFNKDQEVLFIFSHTAGDDSTKIYVNNSANLTSTFDKTTPPAFNVTSTYSDVYIGGDGLSNPFKGYFQELLIYQSLTPEQVTNVKSYLNAKYNIY